MAGRCTEHRGRPKEGEGPGHGGCVLANLPSGEIPSRGVNQTIPPYYFSSLNQSCHFLTESTESYEDICLPSTAYPQGNATANPSTNNMNVYEEQADRHAKRN